MTSRSRTKAEIEKILENREMIKDAIRENLSELDHWAYDWSAHGNFIFLALSESGNLTFFLSTVPVGFTAISKFRENEHAWIALLSAEIDLAENDFALNLLKNTKDKTRAKEIQEYIKQNPCAWCGWDEECQKVYNQEDYDNGIYSDARSEIIDKLRKLNDYLALLEKELEKEGVFDDLAEALVNNSFLEDEE